VVRVPFGLESVSKAELDLLPAQLQVMVAVVAADFTQVGPVSVEEIDRVVECSPWSYMAKLERAGWVEVAGTLPRSTSKLYRSTAKARKLLGLERGLVAAQGGRVMHESEEDGTGRSRLLTTTCERCGRLTDSVRVFPPTPVSPAQAYTPRFCRGCEDVVSHQQIEGSRG
jgi:hypothetical protein